MTSTTTLLTSKRVFPENYPKTPHTELLSILDASVANFSSCSALWFFRTPISSLPVHLESSLRKTLESYPQLCGQLSKVQYKPEGDHTTRYGRLQLTWGSETDPGVEFCTAKSSRLLSDFLPKERKSIWDASQFPSNEFFPPTNPTTSLDNCTSCMVIQVTSYACGGLAIVVRLHHSLADAYTLSCFARHWTAIAKSSPPPSSPIFLPQTLDLLAAGNIDASTPSASLIAKSRSLPIERFDWYASSANSPHAANKTCAPPELQDSKYPPGTSMPWSEWDTHAPVAHTILHFSHATITGMWEAVQVPGVKISKHDAVVAHVWSLINRARGNNDEELVHLDYTIGLRARVSPPLSKSFLGSPLIQTDICSTGATACASAATMAANIRSTLQKFGSEEVAAVLHDMCFQDSAQRIWQAFLGRRHAICTSWVGTGVYECDFGVGEVDFVLGFMPFNDGIVLLNEAGNGEHWSDQGLNVSVYLEKGAMERLVEDEWLKILLEKA